MLTFLSSYIITPCLSVYIILSKLNFQILQFQYKFCAIQIRFFLSIQCFFSSKISCTSSYFTSYFRYDFDGTFVNGKINGIGVLTISPESTLQHKCIIVKSSVFDLPSPDKIEGEFQVRPRDIHIECSKQFK